MPNVIPENLPDDVIDHKVTRGDINKLNHAVNLLDAASTGGGGGGGPHTHSELEVTALTTDLANKAAVVHSHTEADVTALAADLAAKAPTVHTHASTDLASGIIPTARLGSGVADATTILYGDSAWRVPPAGGGGASLPNLPERIVAASTAPAGVRALADDVCDGIADNVQIQALLDAGYSVRLVGATGGTVAQFNLAAALTRKFDGQWIRGEGLDATRLFVSNATNIMAITNSVPLSGFRWGGGVADLSVDGNMGNQASGGGVSFDTCYFAEARNLRVLNTRQYGMRWHTSVARFNAYSKAHNVTLSVGLGNGFVVDDTTEFIELIGCNASFFQGGTIATNYYDDVSAAAGIGLYLRGGNNHVAGGHFDRCRVPIYLFFSHGNRLLANTDNALDTAVFVKGSRRNTFELHLGRLDPFLADGTTPNSRYDLNNVEATTKGRAINIQNNSGGNTFKVVQHPDTDQPVGYSGLTNADADNPFGGWMWCIGENNGAGATAYDGPNRVLSVVPSIARVKLDSARTAYEITANSTLTVDQAGWLYGGDFTPLILCNPSAGALALVLPDADVAWGREFRFVNIHATQNTTIAAGAGDSIQQGTITLTPGQYATVRGPADQYGRTSVWIRVGGGPSGGGGVISSPELDSLGYMVYQGPRRGGTTGGLFAQQFPLLANLRPDGNVNSMLLTSAAQAGRLNIAPTILALPDATPGMFSAAQAAITAAPANSEVDLVTVAGAGPGVYRGTFSGPPNTGVTIKGRGQISIRASNNWSPGAALGVTWSPSGANYLSSAQLAVITTETGVGTGVPVIGGGTHLYDAQHRHMVFLDHVPQRRVSSATALTAGTWKAVNDGVDEHILLFANPAGHLVEVTTRESWVSTIAAGTVWDGVDFRHIPSGNNSLPGLQNASLTLALRHCSFSHGHGCLLALGGSAVEVSDCVLHSAGTAAIQGNACNLGVFERNVIFNTAGALRFTGDVVDWAGYDYNWGSGGIKIADADGLLMQDNYVWNCGFSALWTDIPTAHFTAFWGNKIWDCRSFGIHFEISAYGDIGFNTVYQTTANTWYPNFDIGIYVSSGRQVDVHHNLVMNCNVGMKLFWQESRADLPAGGFTGVHVFENTVLARRAGGGVLTADLFWMWTDEAGAGANINDATNYGYNNYFGTLGSIVGNVWTWSDDYQWYSALGGLPGQDASKYWLNLAAVKTARWENGNGSLPGGGATLTRMLTEAERLGHRMAWNLGA